MLQFGGAWRLALGG